MVSCVMTVIKDRFPSVEFWKIVAGIASVSFIIGCIYTTPSGQYLINFLDFYGASFVALILAIIELLTVSWIYGVERFCDDIEFMLNRKTGIYWRVCWKFITPLIMVAIFINFCWTWKPIEYQGYQYPQTMHGCRRSELFYLNFVYFLSFSALGWCISMLCLLQLPIWAFYEILKQKKDSWSKGIFEAFKPNSQWGPKDEDKSE